MAHRDNYNPSSGNYRNSMGIVINGVNMPDPSEITWGLSDISQSDAGRDESGTMHPMKLTVNGHLVQKYQYQMGWNMCTPAEASIILNAINSTETFTAILPDPLSASGEALNSRTYYVGDRSAPFQQWHNGTDGKLYQKVSFTLIEV